MALKSTMDQVKTWVLKKCKDAPRLLQLEKDAGAHTHRVVVTPKNIPEFTIPKTLGDGKSVESGGNLSSDGELAELASQSSGGSLSCSAVSLPMSNHSSPKHSPSPRGAISPIFLQPPGRTHRSKSAPVSPCHVESPSEQDLNSCSGVHSCDFLYFLSKNDATNADPMSLAAMSLPHFKVKTNFGFDTLSQAPHTRRRESLFHLPASGTDTPSLNRNSSQRRHKNYDGTSSPLTPLISIDLDDDDDEPLMRNQSCKRRNVPSVVTPLGMASSSHHRGSGGSDCSPQLSPLSASPNNSPRRTPDASPRSSLTDSPPESGLKRRSSRRQKQQLYYRRRSSLPGIMDSPCPFCHQHQRHDLEEEESSSPEESPNQQRRRSSHDNILSQICSKGHKLRRAFTAKGSGFTRSSSMYSRSQANHKNHVSKQECRCSYTRSKLEARLIAELGEVKLSLQHFEKHNSLKVTLIKAENLGGQGRGGNSTNSLVKLCLMPGKQQRQSSAIIKHTRDPVFNQQFTFCGITKDDLTSLTLKLRFFHKHSNLRREELLGEVNVAMAKLDLTTDTRFWKNLEKEVQTEV